MTTNEYIYLPQFSSESVGWTLRRLTNGGDTDRSKKLHLTATVSRGGSTKYFPVIADSVVDYAEYGGRLYYVTRHSIGTDRPYAWRTCDGELLDERDVVPPSSWNEEDFAAFIDPSYGLPLMVKTSDGKLAVLKVGSDGTRRFSSVDTDTDVGNRYSFFGAETPDGGYRLYRLNGERVDRVYVPNSTVPATAIMFICHDDRLYVFTRHRSASDGTTESWKTVNLDLEDERTVARPDWAVGSTERSYIDDSNVLRVISSDGRLASLVITNNEYAFEEAFAKTRCV